MPSQLSNAHRRELRTLTNLAERDLSELWREFGTALAAKDRLMDILPRLTALYGAAAASLAADYYDDLRDISGARGRFMAIAAEPAPAGALEVLAGVAVGPLFGAKPDLAAALTLARGGLQRHVANAARGTVTASSIQDPAARGWERAGSGNCEFCRLLISRGGVYTQESADFEAHDHCGCVAVPSFA